MSVCFIKFRFLFVLTLQQPSEAVPYTHKTQSINLEEARCRSPCIQGKTLPTSGGKLLSANHVQSVTSFLKYLIKTDISGVPASAPAAPEDYHRESK